MYFWCIKITDQDVHLSPSQVRWSHLCADWQATRAPHERHVTSLHAGYIEEYSTVEWIQIRIDRIGPYVGLGQWT